VGKVKRVEALKREKESITAKLERLNAQKEELGKKLQVATDEAYVTEERLTLFTRKLTEAENGDTTDEEDADVGIGSESLSSLSLQSPSQGNSDEVKELKCTVQGLAANLAQLTALLAGQALGPPAPVTPRQAPIIQPAVMATYAAALGTSMPVASAVVAAAPMSPAGVTQGGGAEGAATPDVSAGVAAKARTAGAARTGANAHRPHPNACLKDAKHPKKGAENMKDDGDVSSDDATIMGQEEFAKKLAEAGEAAAANRAVLSLEEQVNL